MNCSQEPHPGIEFYGPDGGCGECGYRPRECPRTAEHPMMLSCGSCDYLSLNVRQLIAKELLALAKLVNIGVFPDEQAPGMRGAVVQLLATRAEELTADRASWPVRHWTYPDGKHAPDCEGCWPPVIA